MSKRMYYIIGAIVIVLGIGSFLAFRSPAKQANSGVITGDVKRADISKKITATGTIQQPQTYNLSFKTASTGQGGGGQPKIAQVNVNIGDKVKAGEIVAQADLTSLNLQLSQNQASLDSAKLTLDQSKAGVTQSDSKIADAQNKLTIAQNEYNRNSNDVTKSALDAAKSNLSTAQATLQLDRQSTQAKYDQAVASYNIAKQNIADATLVSPIDGTVIATNGKAGEIASSSLPVVTIQSDSPDMQVLSSVDETDYGNVKVGQDVEVTVDSYQGKKFNGKVAVIAPQAQTQSNVTFFSVTIAVTNQDDLLKTGMNANIAILVSSKKDVVAVSSDAVKGDGNNKYVQIMDPASNQEQKVSVGIGIDDGVMAEVTSGLQVGDKVIIGYKISSTGQQQKSGSNPLSSSKSSGGGGGSAFRAMRGN